MAGKAAPRWCGIFRSERPRPVSSAAPNKEHGPSCLRSASRAWAVRLQRVAALLTVCRMPMFRVILDAEGTMDVPEAVVARAEPDAAVGDDAVDEAFALLADVYDFWRLCHFRDSLDDRGARLVAVVHVGVGYENATWEGDHALIGDGGLMCHRLTSIPSLVYGLCAKGVLGHLPLRDDTADAAALRTGCANVFACLTEQFTRRQPAASASWLVGEDILRPEAGGGSLYSLAIPGQASSLDRQIARIDDVPDKPDPAIVAGVPGHAFYRFAMALEGYAWETAGRVWYAALTDERAGKAWRSLSGFADLTVAVAGELYGREVAAMAAGGWRAVGVKGSWPADG